LSEDLLQASNKIIGFGLGIRGSRDIGAKSINGREAVVVLEVVHEVIGDRRLVVLYQLSMIVDNFGLQVGNVNLWGGCR
jgi:hypothetical protein